VLEVLAPVGVPGAEVVGESIAHVAVTGVCECGCASFNVRDSRYPAQSHHLAPFANGWTTRPSGAGPVQMASVMIDEIRLRAHARPLDEGSSFNSDT
jgi:hypothetical protein